MLCKAEVHINLVTFVFISMFGIHCLDKFWFIYFDAMFHDSARLFS